MADKFDPYREALVLERKTIWPDEFQNLGPERRQAVEEQLHADPARAAELEYVRLYSGFCRQITVTAADLERLKALGS